MRTFSGCSQNLAPDYVQVYRIPIREAQTGSLISMNIMLYLPRAHSYLSSRLLGYVTIGYIVPSSHYLGNWSPRVLHLRNVSGFGGAEPQV